MAPGAASTASITLNEFGAIANVTGASGEHGRIATAAGATMAAISAVVARFNRIDHGLLLPILLYCTDPLGRPMLGPPREGPETEQFLRTAYQDLRS